MELARVAARRARLSSAIVNDEEDEHLCGVLRMLNAAGARP